MGSKILPLKNKQEKFYLLYPMLYADFKTFLSEDYSQFKHK